MNKTNHNKLTKLTRDLDLFLKTKITNGHFPLDNYYGEIFFAGATENKKIRENILNAYLKKNKADIDFHWEFNNYILQQLNLDYKKFNIYYFNRPFYKKATNWIFLRALILIKKNSFVPKIWGHLLATFTILINQRKGILYDNRLYKKKEISHQYHAFATVVLAEIFIETKRTSYKRKLIKAIKKLKEMCKNIKTFNNGGRGSRQIFGYSSAIYALQLGKTLFGIDSDKEILLLINELIKFQKKDGSIPLCLTKEEFIYTEKDYKKLKTDIIGWESYNRYYDYLGFSYYFFKKTLSL